MDDLDTDWDVIGAALRERKPRYPHEAGLMCALVIAMSALNYHGWADLGFAGLAAAVAIFLVVYHRRNMRHWQKGADSFRALTGRDPWTSRPGPTSDSALTYRCTRSVATGWCSK